MTFVLSEISKLGVIMSSDSSETQENGTSEEFVEVEKTLYFPELNIGVSTWGDAEINGQDINSWLITKTREYCQSKIIQINYELAAFTTFIAQMLDRAFNLDGNPIIHKHYLGIHLGGYNDGQNPGLCHTFIEPNNPRFEGQHTLPSLPANIPAYHLRNGIYEEFALFWPALSGIDLSFRSLIQINWKNEIRPHKDPVAVRAEWLGNWVKLMCLSTKTAGLPEYIGKSVRVLAFDEKAKPRKFRIREIVEERI
jgi:hypothetical protein